MMRRGKMSKKKDNQYVTILGRLLTYMKPYRTYLILALVCAIISVVLSLFTPILIGRAIDYVIGPGEVYFDEILEILTVLIFVIVGSAIFSWLMTYSTNRITFKSVKDLRSHAFNKLNDVPLGYIDSNSHGNIINTIINDIDIVSDGLMQGLAQLFTGVVTIFGTIGFMLSINLGIGLVVVILSPLSLFVAAFISSRTYHRFNEESKIRGELTGHISEMVGNQKVVKTFSYEERAIDDFKEINDRLYESGVMAQFYSSITNPSTRFVNGIIYATVGVLGALSAIAGNLSIGMLTSFLTYANQYTKPFNEISGVVTELQSALASANRVFNLLDEEVEISDEGLLEEVDFDGSVEVENVYFAYTEEQELIKDFNLRVEPGSKVAIVGPTGCGKTTLINLLMRFYDVDEGEIRTSQVPIKDMKRKTLRDMYGMVLQDTWLFEGTVSENIAYGKDDASEEEIIEAAKASHAHDFIKMLPDGYHTIISEDGGNLSQGQKQLLSIARVMIVKPSMLILDEATSSIDTRTEIMIQEAFNKLMEGRTSFIVAHRLSTIKGADVILVMNEGNVIEQGRHDELIEKDGFYANLYNSQFQTATTGSK